MPSDLTGYGEELSRQIKSQRERLNLSQPEAAAQIGVSLRTLQNWEAGRSFPWPKHRRALDKFLRCEAA